MSYYFFKFCSKIFSIYSKRIEYLIIRAFSLLLCVFKAENFCLKSREFCVIKAENIYFLELNNVRHDYNTCLCSI